MLFWLEWNKNFSYTVESSYPTSANPTPEFCPSENISQFGTNFENRVQRNSRDRSLLDLDRCSNTMMFDVIGI